MKLPVKWLNEFVDTSSLSAKELADGLTMSGSKCEGFEYLGHGVRNVVTGRVATLSRHENSDHLWITQIDTGGEKPVQIVTGAQNLKEGDIVPVALHGARLPDGKHIEKSNFRGVHSEGMLCSFQELGLTAGHFPGACENGILTLPEDTPLGTDICLTAGLDDIVLDFEITSNRPDCLSVIGLARETSATFDRPLSLHDPAPQGSGDHIGNHLKVEVKDPGLCPRYTTRVAKNIRIKPSPKWMRDRLHAAGVRPISNIVDITNYVMLEYGQPMHAFDYACVSGGRIIVRRARPGEKTTTLDGQTHTLDEAMLLIADQEKAVGIAGVMGGENSEITDQTRMIVFESANFNGPSVRITAKKLGFRTEASARFEKGIDPEITLAAVNRACELVELLDAGDVVDGIIDVGGARSTPRTLPLEAAKINLLLGTDISEKDMEHYLTRLGFSVSSGVVSIPSWRADVTCMADLAEEVARIYGYQNIPSTLFSGTATEGKLTEKQAFERDIAYACRAAGFDEILTYSMIAPALYDKIRLPADSKNRLSVAVQNPLSEDMSILRTTALPSMLESTVRNIHHRNPQAFLFELATIYHPFVKEDQVDAGTLPEEKQVLILSCYGENTDFYTLKGAVETVLEWLRIKAVDFAAETENPAYHPGRCAHVLSDGRILGVLGQVHPVVLKNFGTSTPIFTAELLLDDVYASRLAMPVFEHLPKFPAVTRDLAVLCDEHLPVGSLINGVKKGAGKLLEKVSLFDIYRGKQIEDGKKSVALSLVLRDRSCTLTDEEADTALASALAVLEKECGAVLRAK